MKLVKHVSEEEQNKFVPFTLGIKIESLRDAAFLQCLFNASVGTSGIDFMDIFLTLNENVNLAD